MVTAVLKAIFAGQSVEAQRTVLEVGSFCLNKGKE